MDRNRLARHAYNIACDRIARDTSLSTSEKRAAWFRLSNAYESRRSRIDLDDFMRGRGLGFIMDRRAA